MHQCHPSYNTIADVTGLSVNTVMKHVTTYVDKQLSTVEHTSYINDKGMKWTGTNCYAILLSFSSKTSKNCQNRPVPFL